MNPKNIISQIDGKNYCVANGHFKRHLTKHNITFQQYYETYVSGICPICPYCFKSCRMEQHTHEYAQTCSEKACRSKIISSAHLSRPQADIDASTKARKQTVKETYGVDNVTLLSSVQTKQRKSEKVIQDNGLTSKQNQQAAARASKKEKYGDEFYNNADAIIASKALRTDEMIEKTTAQRSATNLKKYGVVNPLLLPGNQRKTAKGNASIKRYTMPSGKIVGIRGVEDKALTILLNQFNESDIVIHDAYNVCDDYVTFKYTNTNRHTWTYYPDILVKSENKIIEVKSQWWYDGNGAEKYKGRLENNLRKRQAALNAGYKFEFWIFDQKGSYMVI